MQKDTKNFDRIMRGLGEMVEIAEGRTLPARSYVPADVDPKGIRKRLGLTQDEFAARFGFTPGTVRDWEQGRARPVAAARTLLLVIDREPEAVERALTDVGARRVRA
ncbi:MAG TPA: helix-turn-helix domain-containing protein [Caulobacteraceae bacterium]